jgi:hypothetical protein
MDDRWILVRCRGHRDRRNPLTPLISARAFVRRSRIRQSAEPEDLFGSLPDDEREALTRPIKLFPAEEKKP